MKDDPLDLPPEGMARIVSDLERLNLREGDIVLFRTPAHYSINAIMNATKAISEISKKMGVKALIVPHDFEVIVLTPSEAI